MWKSGTSWPAGEVGGLHAPPEVAYANSRPVDAQRLRDSIGRLCR